MMATYQLSPAARNDLADIWLYLSENVSDQQADAFIDGFGEKCQQLALHPFLGRARNELRPGLRSLPLNPYLIFYDLPSPSLLVIRRVLHQRQDIDSILGQD
ncbi:MAG: type II toxin-antitoxin system RelE/ParE family toxin [Ferruginibacter sp.]|nr:type II toxin-antitoxin system RelE/ParE family toxin [Cytophagales bacterium]